MRPTIKALHHDHIDGSAAMRDVIVDLYRIAGREFPFPSAQAWIDYFQDPHVDMVKKFGTVTGVLQSREALELAGYAYGRRRAREGYVAVRAKFAPQYHVFGGLGMAEAAAAMIGGLKKAQAEFGIRVRPQLCIGRETDQETGAAIARICLEYDGDADLDMACDESENPPEKHLAAYRLTFGSKVTRDCHAGEWVRKEPAATYRQRLLANVRTAVYDLRCHVIGHAIPLCDDVELVRHCVDNGVIVGGCPLSNLVCGHIKDVRELRIDELLDRGVRYTLNADDDLFLPAMDEVVEACDRFYDFSPEQCRRLEENALAAAAA